MKTTYSSTYRLMGYLCPEKFVLNSYIREYDLVSANISALLYMNKIDIDLYKSLFSMQKRDREIYIGLLERQDIDYYHKKQEGIIAAKQMLYAANMIMDTDILSVKNDAVFTINKECIITSFEHGLFQFKLKNEYTMFMKIKDLEFYYSYNRFTSNHNIDIKGINDKILPMNTEFLSFLCEIFYMLQNNPIDETVRFFSEVYEQYIMRKCDIEMYRELNADSRFRINTSYGPYLVDAVGQDMVDILNIERNLGILIELHGIISTIYFNTRRKIK